MLQYKREIAAVILFVFCSIFFVFTLGSVKVLAVSVDGKTEMIKTLNSNILETVMEKGINWEWHDIVDIKQNGSNYDVLITRSFPVDLFIDGQQTTEFVTGGTVGGYLNNKGIVLAKDDEINIDLNNALFENLQIIVKRIVYKEYTKKIKLPFATKTVSLMYSSSVGKMPSNVAGKLGTRLVTKVDKRVDGIVLETKIVKDIIEQKPSNGIKYVALKGPSKIVNGSQLNYKRVLTMIATAYTFNSGTNITATGSKAKIGGVAINPKYCKDLNLGDRLYIESPDGKFVYGYCTVNDTGGVSDANWIDIFLPSNIDCKNFGRRQLKIYVLE